MNPTAINFLDKFEQFREQWSPKIVARMNDLDFKLARIEGEFVWHSHPETDETFVVIEGHLTLRFREGEVHLGPGEMYVVPKGVEHLPVAEEECKILLIEPAGTVNTGDAADENPGTTGEWI